ncbi:hypothetical protein OBBRIDRAFT_407173 [Obba rivulosa]|uniref:Uncharacterized protein n=1 Tax=Obba rivulosa TaxID=1052685 RepID=A0A8E2DG38_9APHY|nr:hypothetical protein OBBRIDRAFT_407173 [Obba rivulosa]
MISATDAKSLVSASSGLRRRGAPCTCLRSIQSCDSIAPTSSGTWSYMVVTIKTSLQHLRSVQLASRYTTYPDVCNALHVDDPAQHSPALTPEKRPAEIPLGIHQGAVAHSDLTDLSILCRTSMSLTPSRESSKPTVSINVFARPLSSQNEAVRISLQNTPLSLPLIWSIHEVRCQ